MAMKSLLDINEHTTADEIRAAVAAGADPNANGTRGWTPLHGAHNAEQTKALLDAGANPNAQTIELSTPLHCAKDVEQMKVLLAAGSDPNARDNCNNTPLRLACFYYFDLQPLLDAGADPNAGNDALLHRARNVRQTKALLAAGVDPNARNGRGQTPLHCARDAEQTKALLDAGAETDAVDNCGRTALFMSRSEEQTRVLLAHGANPNKACLGLGDSLVLTSEFLTPLHMARSVGQTRALLDAGANPNVYGAGVTPLHLAKTAEQTKALLDAGADPNVSAEGNDYWCRFGISYEDGDDPRLRHSGTPLHLAQDLEQTRALLVAGAKIPDDLGEHQRQYVTQVQMEPLERTALRLSEIATADADSDGWASIRARRARDGGRSRC